VFVHPLVPNIHGFPRMIKVRSGFGEIMRNIKRAPYQNKIKKISDFDKFYIEITPNY